MPVIYGQGSPRVGRDGLRFGRCISVGVSDVRVRANVVDFRPNSGLLLRVVGEVRGLDSPVVLEAAQALGTLMARCRDDLADGEREVAAAVWGTERLLGGRAPRRLGGVRVVVGRRAMGRALVQVGSEATRSRLSVSTLPYAPDARRAAVDRRLAARGVRLRALYQRPVCGAQIPPPSGAEVRAGDLVPMDMLVVDDEVAVLPVDPDRPGVGLIVVTDLGWVRLAAVVAESCWERAEGAGGGC